MARTENGPYFDENAGSAVKPVQLTPQQGLKAVPLRAFHVVSTRWSVSLISCRDQIVLVAESVTCIRHFVPKFNFLRCFERRDQFPFPVAGPSRLEGVCPSFTLQHPACADLNTAGRTKPSALDPGNVSIISSHFLLLSPPC
jgi:hypothetical protein